MIIIPTHSFIGEYRIFTLTSCVIVVVDLGLYVDAVSMKNGRFIAAINTSLPPYLLTYLLTHWLDKFKIGAKFYSILFF